MTDITRPYTVHPIEPVGAEVRGLQLSQPQTEDTLQILRADIHRHKLLIVKDQGVLSGQRQLEITQWFGEVESAGFELHERSPDRHILRVSNDENEGFKEFGTAGFHIDGTFMKHPNAYSIYHIISVPQKGETYFVSLNDVYKSLLAKQRKYWDRLWTVKTFKRIRGHQDEPGYVIQPLVYNHPVTGTKTLCIHLGKTSRFLLEKSGKKEKKLSKEKTLQILQDINHTIYRDGGRLIYKHKWEAGDLILSDNLAVAHMASPNTQLPREEVGLRVMHRTIVKGTYRPQKPPSSFQACCQCQIL